MKKLRDVVAFHPDGSAEFNVRVTIAGPNGSATLGPGVRFTRGVQFSGIGYDWIVAHLDDVIG